MTREQSGELNYNYVHGETKSPEFRSWQMMKDRCYNPKNNRFEHYGDKGIKVCERWLHNFESFLEDMGRKPKGMTLGRKDNDGDYTPQNCEWQTVTKQNRNRSITKLTLSEAREIRMLYWSRGYNQTELAKEFGVSRPMINLIINEKRWKEGA